MKRPDFENLLKVLRREPTGKPVQFEFIINETALAYFAGEDVARDTSPLSELRLTMHGFKNAGYDFWVFPTWKANLLNFPKKDVHKAKSVSQNEYSLISDWESFEKYAWPDPGKGEYELFDEMGKETPDGMKIISMCPSGVLENAVELVGFENLCMLSLTDEDLAKAIFDAIGLRLLKYCEICAAHPMVGAIIGNDDWGFKTQTMLPPDLMHKYVFPWHKKIVEAAHAHGKPAILHSCGNLKEIMDDIIDYIGYDGKHSYEDQITPVEEAYGLWGKRVAIMGGIDVDFICRAPEEEVTKRGVAMIEKSLAQGGYALGSGNSIPDFMPLEKYKALLKAMSYFD